MYQIAKVSRDFKRGQHTLMDLLAAPTATAKVDKAGGHVASTNGQVEIP